MDKLAFEKAAHCLLASEWNKRSAMEDYSISPDKITVALCGANMDVVPAVNELKPYTDPVYHLLFLGVEWERKGGEIALEAFRQLRSRGIQTHLHIIGCVPPHDLGTEKGITIIPFLNKNDEADFRRLQQIFLQTAVLFLPTRAECAGVVFSEASAYGIPSITTDTGGVRTYVEDGVNGYALPIQAGSTDYADILEKILHDPAQLDKLRASSRKRYEEKQNWHLWGEKFQALAEKCRIDTLR